MQTTDLTEMPLPVNQAPNQTEQGGQSDPLREAFAPLLPSLIRLPSKAIPVALTVPSAGLSGGRKEPEAVFRPALLSTGAFSAGTALGDFSEAVSVSISS